MFARGAEGRVAPELATEIATAVATDVSTPRAVEDVTIASGAASAALPLVLRMGRSDGLPLHIPHRIGTAFAQRLPGAAASALVKFRDQRSASTSVNRDQGCHLSRPVLHGKTGQWSGDRSNVATATLGAAGSFEMFRNPHHGDRIGRPIGR